MEIIEIISEKKRYLNLLLLGDEDEKMIDRYLKRGTLYILKENDILGECVVTDEGDGVLELKNIAIYPRYQKKGYGKKLIEFIERKYRGEYKTLKVGTGDSPLTVPFYESCGFMRTYVLKDFFIENYDYPIYEGGVMLRDMVYFEKNL